MDNFNVMGAEILDPQGRNMAQRSLDLGQEYVYDAKYTGTVDWAHKAVRGMMYDLCDRGGIKHELFEIDEYTRADMTADLADILREALKRKQDE
jgi:hypothetical protein